jgi:TolA-binding protein
MLSLYSQLTAYQQLRREHRTQMSDRLSQLYQEIQDQLETLQQQEELAIKAEEEALRQFRAFIGADARCLLSTPELAAYAKSISGESFCKQPNSPYSIHFDLDPRKWLLRDLSAPIQILEYTLSWEDVDDEERKFPKTYWL